MSNAAARKSIIENKVRQMVLKMIKKPNRNQRSILAEALRKNAGVQSNKQGQAGNV